MLNSTTTSVSNTATIASSDPRSTKRTFIG
jgi:hypothetical protein